MSLNKSCFTKSLVNDYSRLLKYVVAILSFCFGLFVGYTYKDPAIAFISTIPYVAIYAITGIILVVWTVLEIATSTKKSAIDTDTIYEILSVELVYIIVGFIVIVVTGLIVDVANGTETLKGEVFWNGLLMLGVLTVTNIIVSPIAMAYARCKDEPTESSEAGNP